MTNVETFEQYRRLLEAIAYRMLGAAGDAEDIVQEAWLRWRNIDPATIESPKAFLTTIVTRLAMDQLRSARKQRDVYVGTWLPEPMIVQPDSEALADSVSMAFLVLLESLTPFERAVFLLREVFDYGYDEIATIVEKTEDNCRQMHSRARRHIGERRSRFTASNEERERITRGFLHTLSTGDLPGLLSMLAEDITSWSDGGGKAPAALNPIVGRDRVARFCRGLASKIRPGMEVRIVIVNGEPALVVYDGDAPFSVTAIEIADGLIRGLRGVANPDKLKHIPRKGNL